MPLLLHPPGCLKAVYVRIATIPTNHEAFIKWASTAPGSPSAMAAATTGSRMCMGMSFRSYSLEGMEACAISVIKRRSQPCEAQLERSVSF